MKAQVNGYKGSMYPWERFCDFSYASGFTGREVCPGKGGTCEFEIHINGDIVLALAQYYWVTEDKEWVSLS